MLEQPLAVSSSSSSSSGSGSSCGYQETNSNHPQHQHQQHQHCKQHPYQHQRHQTQQQQQHHDNVFLRSPTTTTNRRNVGVAALLGMPMVTVWVLLASRWVLWTTDAAFQQQVSTGGGSGGGSITNAALLSSVSPAPVAAQAVTVTGRVALGATSSSSSSSSSSRNIDEIDVTQQQQQQQQKKQRFVQGLLDNLTSSLDQWIISGSPASKERAYNVLEEIQRHHDKDPVDSSSNNNVYVQAVRMAQRAGLPAKVVYGNSQAEQRRREAEQRQQWEASRQQEQQQQPPPPQSRSAFSSRSPTATSYSSSSSSSSHRTTHVQRVEAVANDKTSLQREMDSKSTSPSVSSPSPDAAAAAVAERIARAGAGAAFDPTTTGIGGLDDVLTQVKRRVWIPLAAPPALLKELGIHPVRGLLLYGKPGCGKTLLARTLGQILSPLRPITIVSGPQIMDKYVGSSEKNLRDIFDNPPDIYDSVRVGEPDQGKALAAAALHVIVLDEFDAIARTRGGSRGNGDQGDAGVARDSVVNQLLAKMDGIDPLPVPTLVIGLTNKRSLIEPALLRPGRFEVQLEVPPPRTIAQRVSILRVHTRLMHQAGRLLVQDAPAGTAAAQHVAVLQASANASTLLTYEELLHHLAERCDGFTGASLAGVARAAASHALERAVEEFVENQLSSSSSSLQLLQECMVTQQDLEQAVTDVMDSVGSNHDWAEEEEEKVDKDKVNGDKDKVDKTENKDKVDINNNNNNRQQKESDKPDDTLSSSLE